MGEVPLYTLNPKTQTPSPEGLTVGQAREMKEYWDAPERRPNHLAHKKTPISLGP